MAAWVSCPPTPLYSHKIFTSYRHPNLFAARFPSVHRPPPPPCALAILQRPFYFSPLFLCCVAVFGSLAKRWNISCMFGSLCGLSPLLSLFYFYCYYFSNSFAIYTAYIHTFTALSRWSLFSRAPSTHRRVTRRLLSLPSRAQKVKIYDFFFFTSFARICLINFC